MEALSGQEYSEDIGVHCALCRPPCLEYVFRRLPLGGLGGWEET